MVAFIYRNAMEKALSRFLVFFYQDVCFLMEITTVLFVLVNSFGNCRFSLFNPRPNFESLFKGYELD